MTAKGAFLVSTMPYPLEIGLCLSEKQYKHELATRSIRDYSPFLLPNSAATTHIFEDGENPIVCLICVDAETARLRMSNARRAGLFAHEAVHALQECHRITREDNPGSEMEAYFVQHIVHVCIEEYEAFTRRTRKPKGGK